MNPLSPDYLQLHGPFRKHTYPTGVTVGPNACCPVRGCSAGMFDSASLLRLIGPDAEVRVTPCQQHFPAVVSLGSVGEVWRQTKAAHKGYGWRKLPRTDAQPPTWAEECVVTDAAGRIIHGRHPISGVMWTQTDHPSWPDVVALLGPLGQLDLFAPETALNISSPALGETTC